MATCKIYGYIQDGAGIPVMGALVYATPAALPSIIESTDVAIYPSPISTTSTSTGYFELSLVQGVEFFVRINCLNFNEKIRVPGEVEYGLFSLVSVPQQDDTPNDQPPGTNW